MTRRVAWFDGVLWLAVTCVLLSVIRIGFVSGDGIAQSAKYATGSWNWNPNHLLLEPLGAWWQTNLTALGVERPAVDQLKLLSILTGSFALGLFRIGIAGKLAASRFAANHATVWVALASGFSRLWISDETHMVQMPPLVVFGSVFIAYVRVPSLYRAIGMGVWAGVAAVLFVLNALLAACAAIVLGMWHASRREVGAILRMTGGVAFGGLASAGLIFVVAWTMIGPTDDGLLEWLTSYSGGRMSARAARAYGAEFSLTGVLTATARMFYGTGSTVVDLAPFVEVFRDELGMSIRTILNGIAFGAAAIVVATALLPRARRTTDAESQQCALLLASAWVLAISGFGIFWNNSDDQFFFQLAIPLGATVASLHFMPPVRRAAALASLSALVLLWNATAMAALILYPRYERAAVLKTALHGAELVIYPGMDEVYQLLYFMNDDQPQRWLALSAIATQYEPSKGYSRLEERLYSTLARGKRIDVVGVFDIPQKQNPWKYLRQLGYSNSDVVKFLTRFPVEQSSRRAGPFTVRSIWPTE